MQNKMNINALEWTSHTVRLEFIIILYLFHSRHCVFIHHLFEFERNEKKKIISTMPILSHHCERLLIENCPKKLYIIFVYHHYMHKHTQSTRELSKKRFFHSAINNMRTWKEEKKKNECCVYFFFGEELHCTYGIIFLYSTVCEWVCNRMKPNSKEIKNIFLPQHLSHSRALSLSLIPKKQASEVPYENKCFYFYESKSSVYIYSQYVCMKFVISLRNKNCCLVSRNRRTTPGGEEEEK
jgi:hypothetical protein